VVVIFFKRLATPHPNGWIFRSMGHQFGVYLASPSGGCIPFHPDSYVNPFDSCPKADSFIHTNLSTTPRPVTSYPFSLINTFVAAGLLYLHLRPKEVSGPGWNPPFRAYTAAVWLFFASNVFLITVPFIPPAPGYEVFEHIPYYVSELDDPTIRI